MQSVLRLLIFTLLFTATSPVSAAEYKFTNRLIDEQSPYLLQHAHNPVDWYPWGDEAFAKAKAEGKPVFLSIGYSTCHWCHVMEEECFEDPQVGSMMNKYFICIKVDREERPDIDAVYMDVASYLGSSGGWPLTIIMTPDKKPYAAGTYFPKYRKYNIDGLMTMLPVWYRWYRYNSNMMLDNIKKVEQRIKPSLNPTPIRGESTADLETSYNHMIRSFSSHTGGFGRGGTKFPRTHQLLYMLEHYKQTGDNSALTAASLTLDKIRNGGIFDQLGYGIHRYTVDPYWFVPHFEKMLYNQAQVSMCLSDLFALTADPKAKKFAEEIFTYVRRDLTSPEGAFYSAEDADSEGEEGIFYLWSHAELATILSPAELILATKVYGIQKQGNWEDRATREKQVTNILSLNTNIDALLHEEQNQLETIRLKLYKHRSKRIRPALDDKVLTDWNGLMIVSLAKAGLSLQEPKYTEAAVKAYDFIMANMYKDEVLLHRWRGGNAAIDGMLSDYTFMAWAALALYNTTLEIKYIADAQKLMKNVSENFHDGTGVYNMTSAKAEKLLFKKQEFSDLAVPSGNSAAFLVFSELGRLTGQQKYERHAESLAKLYSRSTLYRPTHYSIALYTFEKRQANSYDIVLVGDKHSAEFKTILNRIQEIAKKQTIHLLCKTPENEKQLTEVAPFTKSYQSVDCKTTAYICRGTTCLPPVTKLKEIEMILLGQKD